MGYSFLVFRAQKADWLKIDQLKWNWSDYVEIVRCFKQSFFLQFSLYNWSEKQKSGSQKSNIKVFQKWVISVESQI